MAAVALITPVRNEVEHLPRLIRSIVGQGHRPTRWIIVSDGSDDGTDEVGRRAAADHSFITFVRSGSDSSRDFAAKVRAFDVGVAQLSDSYDYLGNVDADVEFGPDYFQHLLAKFDADQHLGLAGGTVVDLDAGGRQRPRPGRSDIVPGAVQLFRRACFEEVGGYLPLKFGSEDTVASLTAQMRGWSVRVFPDLIVTHHRTAGTADRSLLAARYREGRRDYAVGYHPAFVLAKALRRLPERPMVAGSVARLAGFTADAARRPARQVNDELVRYLRDRQLRELRLRR